MSSSSVTSKGTTADQKWSLAGRRKPTVEIVLQDQVASFTPSYTTLDRIQGEVVITPSQDTRFDELYITFEGSTKTFVESLSAASNGSRTESAHRFLRLVQPVDETLLPQPRIAEAGQTYRIPFMFVVPEQLLPGSCPHPKESDLVHTAHLQLPPSLCDGTQEKSDLAPEMSKVTYAVKARLTVLKAGNTKPSVLSEATKTVRVVPAYPEEPPLNIQPNDLMYCVSKSKDIKKGLFKGKLGTVTMDATQPRSLHLAPLTTLVPPPINTVATVSLRFDPAETSARPPQPSRLINKIKAVTFFAATPYKDYPTKPGAHDGHLWGQYSEYISLSSRNVEGVKWEQHRSSRGSGVFYTTELLVPITLPKDKTWLPTFHSCLISRVYILDLNLSLTAPGAAAAISSPSLALARPQGPHPDLRRGQPGRHAAHLARRGRRHRRPRLRRLLPAPPRLRP